MDEVFKALSDPNRRRMLDLLKDRPGLTVNGLTENFSFSRFAVMKHLRILERANLVVSVREGRERKLYLNAVPIQMIHERWISRYESLWAGYLTKIKSQLERKER